MNRELSSIRPDANMGEYFHKLSKDISWGGRVNIPEDTNKWPKSWVEIEYKSYQNAHKVKLLNNSEAKVEGEYSKVVYKRKSGDFLESRATQKITLSQLSQIINHSISLGENNKRRVYPSGGARYPLEFYFLVQNSPDLETGVYHYNVVEHSLEFIKKIEQSELPKFSGYEMAQRAAVTVFMTGVVNRTTRKYGERGYRYIYLEAGHVGQNIYLAATAIGIDVRALAGIRDLIVEDLLGVDGNYESLIHTVIIG